MRRALLSLLLLLSSVVARADELLDLNAATAAQLEALPGIGKAKAEAIVEERELNGAFASVGDLERVKGIGPALLAKIAPHVQVKGSAKSAGPSAKADKEPPIELPAPPSALDREPPAGKVNLNLATEEELQALNGVTKANAKIIVAYRKVKGPFHNLGDLARVPGLPPKLMQTLQYFVTTRLDANEATVTQLVAYGLPRPSAEALVLYRSRHKRIQHGAELEQIAAMPVEDREKIRPLLWFEKDR